MTPTKRILHEMQESEKRRLAASENEVMESADQLIKDYIHYLKKKNEETVQAFSETNLNLNLCKTFLLKLIESPLTLIETKRNIKEVLETLNTK